MPIPPRAPAESFAALVQWLGRAVVARMGGEQLALPLIALIMGRLRRIKQRFSHIAARVSAAKYVPRRRTAAPRRRLGQPPPPPNELPKNFGWLRPLVPEAVVYASQLEHLFRDAEMAALLAAAPGPMRRALRPLCRMLGVRLPPILAAPVRAPPPPDPSPAAPAAERPPPLPPRPRIRPPDAPPPPAPIIPHACGPPLPSPA